MDNNQPNTDIVPVTKSSGLISSNIPEIGEVLDLVDELFLESEVGIDYSLLQQLLSEENWLSANNETGNSIVKAVGKTDIYDFGEIPRTDRHTIDILWRKYSNDRFGFSVQKEIYHRTKKLFMDDGKLKFNDIYKVQNEFKAIIGWTEVKDIYDLVFDLSSAPIGHLPWLNYWGVGINMMMTLNFDKPE